MRPLTLLLAFSSLPAFAHDGHGAGAVHWHPSDTYGFLLVALLAGIAVWLARGDR